MDCPCGFFFCSAGPQGALEILPTLEAGGGPSGNRVPIRPIPEPVPHGEPIKPRKIFPESPPGDKVPPVGIPPVITQTPVPIQGLIPRIFSHGRGSVGIKRESPLGKPTRIFGPDPIINMGGITVEPWNVSGIDPRNWIKWEPWPFTFGVE